MPSWPVVPIGDDTLLFTNAGMNQFKDISWVSQTAVRHDTVNSHPASQRKHNDLEEWGWIPIITLSLRCWATTILRPGHRMAWDLLTKIYKINRMGDGFAGDKRTGRAGQWQQHMDKDYLNPKEKVLFCNHKDNFWEMEAAAPAVRAARSILTLG